MEQVAFLRSRHLHGFELKKVSDSRRLWTWFNLDCAFCALLQADSRWRYRKQVHVAIPGTVVLMEPGETHVTVEAWRPATFGTLFVAPGLIDEICRDLGWGDMSWTSVASAFA